MNIGLLRHPLKIEAYQTVQDPVTGEMTQSWVELATVWAAIESVSGREFMAASAEQASTTHRITIYYRDDLTPAMRLTSGSKHYQIKALLPNNDRSELVIMCEVLN